MDILKEISKKFYEKASVVVEEGSMKGSEAVVFEIAFTGSLSQGICSSFDQVADDVDVASESSNEEWRHRCAAVVDSSFYGVDS